MIHSDKEHHWDAYEPVELVTCADALALPASLEILHMDAACVSHPVAFVEHRESVADAADAIAGTSSPFTMHASTRGSMGPRVFRLQCALWSGWTS